MPSGSPYPLYDVLTVEHALIVGSGMRRLGLFALLFPFWIYFKAEITVKCSLARTLIMYTDSTDLISQIFKINIGVYLIFFGLWMMALNAQFWQANFMVYSTVMGVALAAASIMVIFELKGLRRFKMGFTQGVFAKQKYFALAPNIAGFALLGIGAYVLSIFNTESLQTLAGGELVFFWHPYMTEALVLILSGSAIVFLSMALYYRLIPDQETTQASTQS